MTIEETLISWLSEATSNKLWPLVMPEGFEAFPGCTYQRLKDFHPTDGDGPYGAAGYLIRIVVWGDEFGPVRDMGEAIRVALNKDRETYLVTVDDSDDGIDPATLMFRFTLDVEIVEFAP
ncbi:hypothetical protein [Endozoicomonas acroporae]|uniref:hypothetical protein n=1 Tax=Endozoicomonas acroporae TaxID=1701104 RepID=UPI0013D233DD|nr:hypothetical protein [Endozoicomonas acroporae]